MSNTSISGQSAIPIDYYNSLGLINDNFIYINKKECLFRLELSLIKNIYIKKEKVLTLNILLLIISFGLFSALTLSQKTIPLDHKIIGYVSAVVILITAFLIKLTNYKIIITTINSNIISTSISAEFKEEGIELVKNIKKSIHKKML